MTASPELAKVLFRIPNEDGSAEVETIWAEPLGQDTYRLDNSPFFAYSVSWRDIVYAPYDDDEQQATFQRVLERAGHRTVRVIFESEVSEDNPHLKHLVSLGCSFEGLNRKYFAIDIPRAADYDGVCSYLTQSGLRWEHADPRYSELYPNNGD